MVAITGAINHAKLQSNHHHRQTNIQLVGGANSSSNVMDAEKVMRNVFLLFGVRNSIRPVKINWETG